VPDTPPIPNTSAWPVLPWREWGETRTSVHLWTQIVGKVALAAAPAVNHWWQARLQLSPRGFTTGALPYYERLFAIEFDFIDQRLLVSDSRGQTDGFALGPMSVASFHRQLLAIAHSFDVDLRIHRRPNEMDEAIPFEQDERRVTYDPAQSEALWRSFLLAHRLLSAFRGPFIGKASPVALYWGSFDLAVARFSGRPAPLHPGGAPHCPDWVQHEAYSRELSAAGWWPGSGEIGPLFYAYAYPQPAGFERASIRPLAASFDEGLGEFVLRYDDIRGTPDPEAAVEDFLATTYAAAADLGDWDRAMLEPADYPLTSPPGRAWTVKP
jgi:hypothetical protein